MTVNSISLAWFQLLLLSAASVLLATGLVESAGVALTGSLVLLLAWLKARVILSSYLGLAQAPTWRSGFNLVLGLFCLLLLLLYLVPVFR